MNTRKKKIIDSLSEELHQRRLAILGGVEDVEGELKNITEEQEAELEEEAQKERIATVLEHLSTRDRQALEEIDEAILRIVRGTYGKCLSCGRYIALARLRALPTTRLCIDCARAHEGRAAGAEEETEESRLPADLSLLDDEEIEAVLNDMVRDAGNIDRDELHISSRDGVIHLDLLVVEQAQVRGQPAFLGFFLGAGRPAFVRARAIDTQPRRRQRAQPRQSDVSPTGEAFSIGPADDPEA